MKNIDFLVGDNSSIEKNKYIAPLFTFDSQVISFFDSLSKELMNNKDVKKYPDIVTFAFYIRKSNALKLKDRFTNNEELKQGLGVAFHIAPSNVPVNFAYTLFVSLLCGNINYVKVSNKEFEQVNIICDAIDNVLDTYDNLKPYINLIRYNNDKEINDYFSSICNIRIIWGGNDTIDIIRESKLKPRAREIAFADRYSFAVIDTNYYRSLDERIKTEMVNSFYNDTFLSDQNACTSPRLVCFIGDNDIFDFYNRLYKIVKEKYDFKDIFASDKYVFSTSFGAKFNNYKPRLIRVNNSNLIYRVIFPNDIELDNSLVQYKGKCGVFFEVVYNDINNLIKLKNLCNDDSIQTISYLGDKSMFNSLLLIRPNGIDRIVPIGKTMDFDLIWDGYDLPSLLTRTIVVS